MEAPLEREIKSAGSGKNQAKKEKSSLEQRLQLTKTMFQLIGFIRKQAPVSIYVTRFIQHSITTLEKYRRKCSNYVS